MFFFEKNAVIVILRNQHKIIFLCNEVIENKCNVEVLLTVHLSIFISVFHQLVVKNLFHNKFYFMPLHVSSTCAYHQEVKIERGLSQPVRGTAT